MTDRLIRITTALAVMAGGGRRRGHSYQHAYELVRSHGESGVTARDCCHSRWTGSSGPRPRCRWTPAAGASRYHAWRRGALAQASSPRSARTWRTASGTARSAPWSACGPRWRWLAHSSFLRGSLSCCTMWRLNVSRRGSATPQPRVVHVVVAAQSPADCGRATYATLLAAVGEVSPSLLPARFAMTPLMSVLHPERMSCL